MAIGISRRQVAGRWGQSDAGGAKGEAGGGARRRAQEKALAVLLNLGLGQRVEVGDNIGPGAAFCCVAVGSWLAQIGDAVLELLFQHEGKETARDVAANGLVELMKDRPRGEQALRRSEGPFHPP